jgi:hypothetical protein
MGASADAESAAPFPIPAHQTGHADFLASGFPTGFTADSRTRVHVYLAELQYS